MATWFSAPFCPSLTLLHPMYNRKNSKADRVVPSTARMTLINQRRCTTLTGREALFWIRIINANQRDTPGISPRARDASSRRLCRHVAIVVDNAISSHCKQAFITDATMTTTKMTNNLSAAAHGDSTKRFRGTISSEIWPEGLRGWRGSVSVLTTLRFACQLTNHLVCFHYSADKGEYSL